KLFGLETGLRRTLEHFGGAIEDVSNPSFLEAGVVAVVSADDGGRIHQAGLNALRALATVAGFEKSNLAVLLFAPASEPLQRRALAQAADVIKANITLVPTLQVDCSDEMKSRLLVECLTPVVWTPQVVLGEAWTEEAFSCLSLRPGHTGIAVLRARRIDIEEDRLFVETARLHNKLRVQQSIVSEPGFTWWIHLSPDAEIGNARTQRPALATHMQRWSPRLEGFYASRDIQQLIRELKMETGLVRLSDADFIVDVGFGVGNQDGYEAVIQPLEKCLRELGVRDVRIGGSRKVTEELHLLPPDRQIGQSG